MYTNPIEAFAINILKTTNVLPENTVFPEVDPCSLCGEGLNLDRKSTRLNSSHSQISYAVFCLKKKKKKKDNTYNAKKKYKQTTKMMIDKKSLIMLYRVLEFNIAYSYTRTMAKYDDCVMCDITY